MTAEWRAVESLPASLHDVRGPANSRSNTRTSRAPAGVETGGQASRHHNLLPSCPGRRSFARLSRARLFSQGMIEYDDRDQIPAFLLPSSHSGRKFIAERPSPKPRSDRVLPHALETARDTGGLLEAAAGSYLRAWSDRVRSGARTPSYVPNFTAYGGTCLKYEGISRVGPTIRIRRPPFQYRWTEWSHRQSSSAPVQRW